ncbi:MAG: hypothetical protein JO199_02630 [Candidatus Eremiobacteraeota bacterium]|nr:hypothetical protein [Candidatus Eremiobacteraeota bacterium]
MNALSSPAAAVVAGLMTSAGPCVAPRFLAMAALAEEAPAVRRALLAGAFVMGLCASYVVLGLSGAAVGMLGKFSSIGYAVLCAAALIAGVRTIAAGGTKRCRHDVAQARVGTTPAAAFLAGFGGSAISSPCCGPLAMFVGGAGVAAGDTSFAASMLAAFALGHALPLVTFGCISARIRRVLVDRWPAGAVATVSGALTLALGGYYGILV